ncbi:MAG: T9SS type A sorting domain-containing protein [Bacteroidota bacterium]|nr:T9SS type A sorting domain-containing protein [Bacteroidota bacterium]
MKKILSLIIFAVLLQTSLVAQDFALTNPTMNPNPGVYPGGTETVSFNFSVSQSYTFSSNPASNNYAFITFSFTKLNPTSAGPSGTGASLFNWTLTNNGGTGVNLVYTWTGTSKDVTLASVPNTYTILFTNVPITAPATRAETDIRVAGQFTAPANATTDLKGNNYAVIATYTAAGGVVPIRLLSFSGIKEENKVHLNWKTSYEQNNNYFDVEFSKDGNQWASIGRVASKGNSTNEVSYSLVHKNPVNGANFYRLKEVGKDGNYAYSNVVVINFVINGLSINSVYPNPFSDKISIAVSSENSAVIHVLLSDNLGRVLKSETVSIQKGVNEFLLNDLGNLSPGLYSLQIKTPYTTVNYKIKK